MDHVGQRVRRQDGVIVEKEGVAGKGSAAQRLAGREAELAKSQVVARAEAEIGFGNDQPGLREASLIMATLSSLLPLSTTQTV